MKNDIITSLKVFSILSLLLGIIYPLIILAIGQITMHNNANGSLIVKNNEIIGSTLIGQSFANPKYFHSRPSATNYNASTSGGSNLAPSSKKFIEQVHQRILVLREKENISLQTPIPAGMVLQSASGLDPHISIENARIQIHRVSQARNLPENTIIELLKTNMDYDLLGIWGQNVINVLKINSALDSHNLNSG